MLAVVPAALWAPPAAAAATASCRLSLHAQGPPGGTPAYELKLARRGTSCAHATRVMKAFHGCRTSARIGCPKPVLGSWRCRGRRDASGPGYFHGSFTCARRGARVAGSYAQSQPGGCFGAAARDPQLPCFSRARSVTPALGAPDAETIWHCNAETVLDACTSGVSDAAATRRVALVGDSHSLHWSAALNVVALLRRWRVYSHFAGGCFFSTVAGRFTRGCGEFYDTVAGWFVRHPEVSTVFVTSNADTPVAVAAGEDMADVKTRGFREAFEALPPTVKQIVVLRDTPKSSEQTLSCAYRAIAAGTQRLAAVCPLARSIAVRPDLAVAAVRQLRSPRYGHVDLTPFMCSSASCYPVVGGTLVNADEYGHLTMTFMRTLAPYLMRGIRRLEAARRRQQAPEAARPAAPLRPRATAADGRAPGDPSVGGAQRLGVIKPAAKLE